MRYYLLKVVLYYLTGSVICYVAYLFIPYEYIQASGVHHILIFLMFFISFVCGFVALIISILKEDKIAYRWMGIFHLVPVSIYATWFGILAIYS